MTAFPVAQTILDQLGGSKFYAMTGAHCIASEDHLHVVLPRAARRINSIVIRLQADDTYTVLFNRRTRHGMRITQVASEHGVHAEDLQRLFTSHTGLETSL